MEDEPTVDDVMRWNTRFFDMNKKVGDLTVAEFIGLMSKILIQQKVRVSVSDVHPIVMPEALKKL